MEKPKKKKKKIFCCLHDYQNKINKDFNLSDPSPVVSITIWSNFPFFLFTNSPIILTRSPLTVQHKHPLLSMTISSAPVAFAATKEPSISTSPYWKNLNATLRNLHTELLWQYIPETRIWCYKAQSYTSFSITAMRFPWSAVRMWFSSVVWPWSKGLYSEIYQNFMTSKETRFKKYSSTRCYFRGIVPRILAYRTSN